MFILGALVNGIAILFGTLVGRLFRQISERMKETVMYGISLAVILLGIQMSLKTQHFLIVLISLVIGGVIGEQLDIESWLVKLGKWLESKVGSKKAGNVGLAFVTSTLIFAVGAMAIIGALDSGMRHDHTILYMKSVSDGFVALILSTTLGIGVIFSAIPVFLYEGFIALFATQIGSFVPADVLNQLTTELSATGGLLIVAIGLNLMNLTKIRVANLLPSMAIVPVIIFGLRLYHMFM